MITQGQGIELLQKSLPYPEQLGNYYLEKEGVIYFDYRAIRYKLDLEYLSVMKSSGCILEGNDTCLLMEHLIKYKIGFIKFG
jgi:hypothetical protein